MYQPKIKPAISFLLLFIWHSISFVAGQLTNGTSVTFHVKNKCTFPIWPATAPTAGYPVIAEGGFFLASGLTKRIKAPSNWSGRFWARTGCHFTNSSESACKTGDCLGLFSCNGASGLPPATLLEVSLEPNKSKPSFYDVSLVDGYNLPISVSTKPADSNCVIKGCTKSVNSLCPKEHQVLDQSGVVVACKSACLVYDDDTSCCRNLYGSPESCQANKYSKIFKNACPSYVSYAFDSPSPLVQCSSKDYYVITFCPSRWTALEDI